MPHSSPIPLRLRRPSQSQSQPPLSPSLPGSAQNNSTTTLNIQHVVLGNTILIPTVEGEFPSSLVYPLDGSRPADHQFDAYNERETKARAEWLFVCEKCCKYEVRPEVYRAHVRFCSGWGDEPCEEPVAGTGSGKGKGKGKKGAKGKRKADALEEEEVVDEGPGHPTQRRVVFKGRNGERVYEVDGKKEKLFCQCLSALASCFIESKSVSFDVESFLFYVLYIPVKENEDDPSDSSSDESPAEVNGTSTTRKRRRGTTRAGGTATTRTAPTKRRTPMKLAGFFSKEKKSWDEYNLACILVFPQYQGLGLGRLLVELSYALALKSYHASVAAREAHTSPADSTTHHANHHHQHTSRSVSPAPVNTSILAPSVPWGAPEKPLSKPAEGMYRSFWHSRISQYLYSLAPQTPSSSTRSRTSAAAAAAEEKAITVRDISAATGIHPDDVIATLRSWEAVVRKEGKEEVDGKGNENVNVILDMKKVPVMPKSKRWTVADGWVAAPAGSVSVVRVDNAHV